MTFGEEAKLKTCLVCTVIFENDSIVICPVWDHVNWPKCSAVYNEKKPWVCGFDPWENEKAEVAYN